MKESDENKSLASEFVVSCLLHRYNSRLKA